MQHRPLNIIMLCAVSAVMIAGCETDNPSGPEQEILVGDNTEYTLDAGNSYSVTITAPEPVKAAFVYVTANNTTGITQTIDLRLNDSNPVLKMTLAVDDQIEINALARGFDETTSFTFKDFGSTGIVKVAVTLWVKVP